MSSTRIWFSRNIPSFENIQEMRSLMWWRKCGDEINTVIRRLLQTSRLWWSETEIWQSLESRRRTRGGGRRSLIEPDGLRLELSSSVLVRHGDHSILVMALSNRMMTPALSSIPPNKYTQYPLQSSPTPSPTPTFRRRVWPSSTFRGGIVMVHMNLISERKLGSV